MWLNEPVEIIDSYRVVTETQTIWYNYEGGEPVDPSQKTRSRKVTWYRYRYVGCDFAGAKTKADALSADSAYYDIDVVPIAGGQYHCIANKKVEGNWSAWE